METQGNLYQHHFAEGERQGKAKEMVEKKEAIWYEEWRVIGGKYPLEYTLDPAGMIGSSGSVE